MQLNDSLKARIEDRINRGNYLAGRLRTTGPVQEQSASPSAHVVWGGVGSSSNDQHIVWGCIGSSSGSTNESSCFKELRLSKKSITDDVLVLGADNTSSEPTSDLQLVEPADDEEAENGQKASLQMRERSGRHSNESVIRNLDKPLDEDQKQRDAYLLLAKQALINQGLDVEELLPQVPLDEFGSHTSIGSIGHSSQNCRGPCAFINRSKGCTSEIFCLCCHFPHAAMRKHLKDGKTKRDRYRKLKQSMMQQIEKAPYNDNFDSSLPGWIEKDGWLKGKLVSCLKAHQETVQKRLVDL